MAKISIQRAGQMMRRLGTGLGAGVSVVRLWEMEQSRGTPQQKAAAEHVLNAIKSGHTLAEAMKGANDYYRPMMLQLVSVGEQTGKLEAVFSRLADHYEHQVSVRRTFLQAIAWPSIQLGLAILIIGALIWIIGAVLPRQLNGDPVDILGFGLYGTKGALIFFTIVGLIAASIAMLVMGLMKGWYGEKPLMFAMKIPVIGKCLETIALARLSWAFSICLESGMDARRTMATAWRSTQNPYYTRFVEPADKMILHGGEFHEAMAKTGVIPDEFVDMLAAAEIAGTQTETMTRMSIDYQQRAESSIRLIGGLLTGIVWVTVAGLIIMMIFRLAMFYLNTIDDALNGM